MASSTDAKSAVRELVDRINAQDAHGIVALCTADHAFIDSLGTKMSGADKLAMGWGWYFSMFPDYRIDIQSLVAEGDLVLACGYASATHAQSKEKWRISAAWRARVVDGLIAEWQVYADNKPVYELLARST